MKDKSNYSEEIVRAENQLTPIIRTKLYRPPVADDIVCRGELHKRLEEGWNLPLTLVSAPADIRPRFLSTAIDLEDQMASLDTAFEVAEYFGIDLTQARGIAAEVGKVVSGWRVEARQFGLSRSEIDRMTTAFEHGDLKTALKRT